MTNNNNQHPVCGMSTSAKTLRNHAEYTHSQAVEGVAQARKASEALAALDLDKAFHQLRRMVSLLNDRPGEGLRADNVVQFPAHRNTITPLAQAAE